MTDNQSRLPLEPMDPRLTNIQPGGGIIIHLEQRWGYWRRWWLKTFRKGYVARMQACRKGTVNGCPHEVLDPRDLKYFRNQPNYWWEPQDDPFIGRNDWPFARVGLAELIAFSILFFGPAIGLTAYLVCSQLAGPLSYFLWTIVVALVLTGTEVVWFFRNPKRIVPTEPGLVISPADGKVVLIEEIEHDEFIGGPAVLIGIFLSIFNVHINRSPVEARVIGLRYKPGKYLNALRPESARENEQVAIRLEENVAPYRRMIVRQITGAIARRIVCWLKPGDELGRGAQFGMIKLGSRTELLVPKEEALEIITKVGDTVLAGESILARYRGRD